MEQLKIKFFAKQVRDISLIYENKKISDLYWYCLPFTMTIRVIINNKTTLSYPLLFGTYQCYNSSNSCHHMKKSCVISDDRDHPIASLSKTTNAFYGRDLQMTHCLETLDNCGSLIYLFLLNSLHKVLLVMFPK